MCDPLTIAGIALTAGATAANTVANNQVAQARADALAAERIRQQGLDQQAAAVNETARGRYDNFGDQQGQKSQELGDYLAAQSADTPAPTEAVPTTSSNITVQEMNRQSAKAKGETNASAAAGGELRSFGDLLGNLSRSDARDAGTIGQIGGFKRGWAGVLPLTLEAAAQKGAGLRTLADVMGGFGSIATGAGLSGGSLGNLFAGGAAPAAAAPAAAPTVLPALSMGTSAPRFTRPGVPAPMTRFGGIY